MDKYDQLNVILEKAVMIIEMISPKNSSQEEFLMKYKDYIKALLQKCNERILETSKGGALGLLRWLSDYYNLENYDALWDVIESAEDYYSHNF